MPAHPAYTARQVGSRETRDATSIGLASSFVLMLTSVLLLHVSIQDGSPRPWVEWADLVITILLAASAFYYFRNARRDAEASGNPTRERGTNEHRLIPRSRVGLPSGASSVSTAEVVFLLLFVCLPFISDIATRRFAMYGNPMEIVFPLVIRNLMFGLIVLPRSTTGRLAMFTSLFLAIFGALVANSTTTNVLLAIYALLGLWWLMGDYWRRISAHFPDETTTEIPYFARVGAIGLVLFFLAGGAVAFQSNAVTSAVAGFMPSSGGTGGSDPFARGGIGDGEQMVGAKEDADSFGPIESELFMESQQPTLYDMFIENYAEASIKKRKSISRAIPLSSKEMQKQNHTKFGQNKKATREFSAIRRQSADRKRRKLEDTESKAMLYVAGRTPLHLGLAIYDHWDGQKLSLQCEIPKPRLHLESVGDRKWATIRSTHGDCFGEAENHQLKIINLNSPTIPSPPNLTATHIDKLHDAGFFKWENGLWRLRSTKIPSLTVVHVKSRLLRRERLDELKLRRETAAPATSEPNTLAPLSPNSFARDAIQSKDLRRERIGGEGSKVVIGRALTKLAADWTASASSDWERVELICEQLRTFDHDSKVFVPEDTPDAVEHFLFESQQGPDYLFATSAAVLLRSLGYQTRIVSGLYADPNNYDRMAKATGVHEHNVHFWMEIETENGHWVPVEATPGFEVLYARQTLLQATTSTITACIAQVLARPISSLMILVGMIGGFAGRRQLFGMAATQWWQLRLNTSPRQQVIRSVSLLQRLTTRKKSGRREGQTIDQWIESISESCHDSSAISEFRSLVSWACYASSDRPAFATNSVRQICVESVNLLKERV